MLNPEMKKHGLQVARKVDWINLIIQNKNKIILFVGKN
jgi:hypothetical protein